jgi:predicted MFS family arabinose efflux permease
VSPTPTAVDHRRDPALVAWRNAVATVFTLVGLTFASWASRIPVVRDDLGLSTAGVAALVFCLAAGSIVGLLGAPAVVGRLGGRRSIRASMTLVPAALVVTGLGAGVVRSFPLAAAGMVIFGVCYGTTEVVMNLQAAEVERRDGRTLMPLMHGFFSVGTILGAVLGFGMSALGVGVAVHFLVTAVVVATTVLLVTRAIPLGEPAPTAPTTGRRERLAADLSVLRDPKLWLIGVVMLGMAFTEGSANDWLTLAAVDGYGFDHTTGVVVYGVFVVAMTVGRFAGGPVLDRFGRVAVLVGVAVVGVAGLGLFVAQPSPAAAFVGAACWGIGASLGFPFGMSAAADHPTHATQRVSAVAIFGYFAFLAGPPALGLLGERFGLLNAFLLVLALLVVSAVVSPAAAGRSRAERAAAA